MAKTMRSLSLSFTTDLSRTMGSRAWKMCVLVVTGVILSDILDIIITTTSTPIMVTILKLTVLPGRHPLHGHSDRERGAHNLTRRAACFHGVEGTMGSFALVHDGLQRLYLLLLVNGSWAINALVLTLALSVFCISRTTSRFFAAYPPDNDLRYIMI
jgi:hypothetical protein